MLSLVNAAAGTILGFLAGALLTEAAIKAAPEGALGAIPAAACGALLIWTTALVGGVLGWTW
jgi:hypothetical protein